MSSRPRGLAANASLALAGDAIAKGGMFVALLVLARGLDIAEFARLGVAMAAMMILTSLLDGGIGTIATRDGASNPDSRRQLLRAGVWARAPLVTVAAIACLATGLLAGRFALVAVVGIAAVVNAAQLALFATFRSGQNLLTEAVAKAFCGVSYPLLCAVAVATGQRTAVAAMLALTIGPLATLPFLYGRARRLSGSTEDTIRPLGLLRRSAPFGLMALATLAYYRAPMLLMGGLASSAQTASYSVAANIAFGLLMLPAAVATGLLPRLAGERDDAVRAGLIGRALIWSTALLAGVDLLVGAASWWLVPALYGPAYRSAIDPLLILLASGLAIGVSGIVGTALIAIDRKREVVVQVVVALGVNLAACLILIPALAADGAALATLATELVSVALLSFAYVRHRTRPAPAPVPRTRTREAALVR